MDGDFSGRVGDGDLEVLDAADFWVGAVGYGEGVFGSVGVIFFVGYLVGSEMWSLVLVVNLCELRIYSIYYRGVEGIDERFVITHCVYNVL